MGIAFCTSVQFGLNELSKRTMASINKSRGKADPSRLSPMQYIICGSIAGAGNSLIATPVELIRITMQNQSSVLDPRLRFSGSYAAVKGIYQMYGAKSLYSGFKLTMIRDVLSYATFFGTYEVLKSTTVDSSRPPNFAWLMLLGSISGVVSWLPAYAFDICKTKVQLDSFSAPLYKGIRHVFEETYRQEGWRGFVKGLKP
jgi:solute carrier family 25 carnitine/acylcarnitine transporter 20/29